MKQPKAAVRRRAVEGSALPDGNLCVRKGYGMHATIEGLSTVARHELRGALRGRMLLGFAALFTLLSLGITLAGLGGSGQVLVQGFARTGVSLLGIAVYLLPLLGLVVGAAAFGSEDGGTELLVAQPVERWEVLLGRVIGLCAALALVAAAGYGAAAALVLARVGVAGIGGYLLVAGGSTAVGLAGVTVGVLLGVVARRRGAAVGWALGVWFAAAVLYDLAAIGVLQVVGSGEPGGWLVAILAANPIDGVRTMGLVSLGADVLLGPTGAALHRLMGPLGGGAWVAASLVAWVALPVVVAARLYARRDF